MAKFHHICRNHWRIIIYSTLEPSCALCKRGACDQQTGSSDAVTVREAGTARLPTAPSEPLGTGVLPIQGVTTLAEQNYCSADDSFLYAVYPREEKFDDLGVATVPRSCFCPRQETVSTTDNTVAASCDRILGEESNNKDLVHRMMVKVMFEDMCWIRRWFDWHYDADRRSTTEGGEYSCGMVAETELSFHPRGAIVDAHNDVLTPPVFDRHQEFSEKVSMMLNTRSLCAIVALVLAGSSSVRETVVHLVTDALVRAVQLFHRSMAETDQGHARWGNSFSGYSQTLASLLKPTDAPLFNVTSAKSDVDFLADIAGDSVSPCASSTLDTALGLMSTGSSPSARRLSLVSRKASVPAGLGVNLSSEELRFFPLDVARCDDFSVLCSQNNIESESESESESDTNVVARRAYRTYPGITEKALLFCLSLAVQYCDREGEPLQPPFPLSCEANVAPQIVNPSHYPAGEIERVFQVRDLWTDAFATSLEAMMGYRTMVILVSGASGCGKSTLAHILANLLGHDTVISTDTIRHILRSKYTKEDNPILYASTYEVADVLRHLQGTSKTDDSESSFSSDVDQQSLCIQGYLMQSRLLYEAIECSVAQFLKAGESVVVEGVHITGELVCRLCERFPQQCIPFVVYLADQNTHIQRLASRSPNFDTTPSKNKYVEHLESIRAIQDYLHTASCHRMSVAVENTSLDAAVETMHSAVVARFHELQGGITT